MKVWQIKLLLSGWSTNTSTGTGKRTSTPENASIVQTLFDLFFLLCLLSIQKKISIITIIVIFINISSWFYLHQYFVCFHLAFCGMITSHCLRIAHIDKDFHCDTFLFILLLLKILNNIQIIIMIIIIIILLNLFID